jgi:hypothetical protein
MSRTLEDPVRIEAPTRSPVRPAAPLDPKTVTRDREVSFELESPGGYRRTVTGTIAYLDEEAQTYMVRPSGAALSRVPIRNIKRILET